MKKVQVCKAMFGSLRKPFPFKVHSPTLARVAALCVLGALASTPAGAARNNEDGLPVPRFVSTHFDNVNVRVGPGTKYDISWIYTTAGTPVEIIAEYDVWRKIEDFDGKQGWIQETQLSGNRTALVAPLQKGKIFPLRAGASPGAPPRAMLPAGFRVGVRHCDGHWCHVNARARDKSGREGSYSGYIEEADLWGALKDEVF